MRSPQGAIHPIARLWKVLRQIPSSYAEPTEKPIHTHLSWFCSRFAMGGLMQSSGTSFDLARRPVPGAHRLLRVRKNVW
ncbi:uncharacterized protein EI90DRAFT_860372 [Cantharellus anzutake]|uniref:uncharacterized protein n=1 Tax=Cantharellus anzutake TaxID=1750568 RepID=UPI001905ACEF|nr:uncharacterized protein EI90DRAFT_860372 [Cantharellus anzutake]KAF8311918.1 hypothetical protein EI90DRAFT_860372 [Cantharellus anzutake]